jgi:plastocyanin
MRNRPFVTGIASALALVLALAAAVSGGSDHRRVAVLDACDGPSFNAALQDPNACSRNGGLAFETFVGQLASMGEAPAWRFAPEQLTLQSGGTIQAFNAGGEFHTFTEVAAFGGGCVQPLNDILGLTPVPECADAGALFQTTGIAPGDELEVEDLAQGQHLFECLIHPWMRTTVVVG